MTLIVTQRGDRIIVVCHPKPPIIGSNYRALLTFRRHNFEHNPDQNWVQDLALRGRLTPRTGDNK